LNDQTHALSAQPGVKIKVMKKLFFLLCFTVNFACYAQSQKPVHKIGYANVAYIQAQLPETKEAEAQLQEAQTQLREQLNAKSQAIQKLYADYNANQSTMPDSTRTKMQQQLQQGRAEFDQMQQDAEGTLQNSQKLLMAQIYLMVGNAIDDVATENGYAVILTEQLSGYNVLLYRDEKVDISNLVLKKLGVVPKPAPAKAAPTAKKK
jgi:outer membrane protein